MALDRESIVRRDFPTHRRGYDPASVDTHLERLAGEVDALQRREPPTVSQRAAEQVKTIIDAAERGAEEIRAAARAEAREHIARVTEAADRLRARLEQMEREVERLHEDLMALQAGMADLGEAAPPAEAAPPEPDAAPEPAAPPTEAATPPAAPPANGDATAARIVALDMALSGTPREETDRYLAEHYDVPDRAALLDDVYAAAD